MEWHQLLLLIQQQVRGPGFQVLLKQTIKGRYLS